MAHAIDKQIQVHLGKKTNPVAARNTITVIAIGCRAVARMKRHRWFLINGAPLCVGDRGSQYGPVGRATHQQIRLSQSIPCANGYLVSDNQTAFALLQRKKKETRLTIHPRILSHLWSDFFPHEKLPYTGNT